MPKRRVPAPVVSLAEARLEHRLKQYRERLERVLKTNRRAITRLYSTGTLFTRLGCRAGRDLLLAHEHLLRVMALLERLSNTGDVPAPSTAKQIQEIFEELDTLLEQTANLTDETSKVLDELKKE